MMMIMMLMMMTPNDFTTGAGAALGTNPSQKNTNAYLMRIFWDFLLLEFREFKHMVRGTFS